METVIIERTYTERITEPLPNVLSTSFPYVDVYKTSLDAIERHDRVIICMIYTLLTLCNLANSYAVAALIDAFTTSASLIVPLIVIVTSSVLESSIDCFIQKRGAELSDKICEKLLEECITEFSYCKMDIQQKISDELFNKVYMVGKNIGNLTWIIPDTSRKILVAIGTVVYIVLTTGVPITLLLFIMLSCACIYRFVSHEGMLIMQGFKDAASNTEELRKHNRFEITSLNERVIHLESRVASKNIASSTAVIEKLWTDIFLFSNKKLWFVGVAVTILAMTSLALTPGATYMTYRMFDLLNSAVTSITNGYSQFMRSRPEIDKLEEVRSKYKLSRRSSVKLISATNVTILNLMFIRPPSDDCVNEFRLSWDSRPLHIDLTHPSIYYIDGPNGAGKSTFFNIITGVIEDVDVEMLIDGELVPDGWLHLMDQRTIIVQSDDIRTNECSWGDILDVGDSSNASDQHYLTVIRIVGLQRLFLETYGGNINAKLEKPSGGERRRLLIARGLLRCIRSKSSILIMDEPDANIDKTFPDIIDGIREVFNGPIFMTLHSTDYLARIKPNYVISISNGRITCN